MHVRLLVIDGPHVEREFEFHRHDTFLVGRSSDAHFQLSYDDPYFSRRHFLVEVNPPRVKVLDLKSRNGIRVNGQKVTVAELVHGDRLKAGHTVFEVHLSGDEAATRTKPCEIDTPHGRVPRPVTLDGYRIEGELGRGAMGIVYRGVQTSDGTPVAIKVVTPAASAEPRHVARFLREVNVLGTLSHPNVVASLGSGDENGVVYLVMEMVDGPDAKRVLDSRGPLSVPVAVRLVCQALAGLAHAHTAGFVHRDVKPANLLLGGPKGRRVVKVADFGLARAFEESQLSGVTMQGEIGGTPAFMAPEQVTHYRDAKPAADQYATAATLYNLLTGEFTHNFVRDVGGRLVQILTERPVPVRDRRADVPKGLAEVIHTALAREPGDRFLDAAALRAALLPFIT